MATIKQIAKAVDEATVGSTPAKGSPAIPSKLKSRAKAPNSPSGIPGAPVKKKWLKPPVTAAD